MTPPTPTSYHESLLFSMVTGEEGKVCFYGYCGLGGRREWEGAVLVVGPVSFADVESPAGLESPEGLEGVAGSAGFVR